MIDFVGIGVALGIGLLIGIERERRKVALQVAGAAGLRTFTLAALTGTLAQQLGGTPLVIAAMLGLAAVGVFSSLRPSAGVVHATTPVALLLTGLLGAAASIAPTAAAALAVLVALLLVEREPLHRFVNQVLTEEEVHDGLLLLAAALIVLPLAPDRTIDPLHALNLRTLWTFAVLMMAINAAGHVALRAFGARFGLPLAGLSSGFVSSTVATLAMGQRAATHPPLLGSAIAAATLASVTSTVQVGFVLAAVAYGELRLVLPALGAAAATGLLWTLPWLRRASLDAQTTSIAVGRPFNPRTAVGFALLIGVVLMAIALLQRWFGNAGALASAALAGLADAHSASASVGALVATGKIGARTGAWAICAAYTANWGVKAALAFRASRDYGWRMLPGLLAMPAAMAAVLAVTL